MSLKNPITAERVDRFISDYDTGHEDRAAQTRGEFLRAFPRSSLVDLSPETYCIGFQSPSFCTFVEVTTRPWANILGATAGKFGIYFGRTKHDPTKRYRFAARFGKTDKAAFVAVRSALVDLVALGGESRPAFAAIDANPLSQMFKAKVLSLYYPKRFLNICSGNHLEDLAALFKLEPRREISRYQHLLVREKLTSPLTKDWSNPKFMAFLYAQFLKLPRDTSSQIAPPDKRKHRDVDFEELLAERAEIGERAEQFARNWEINRLEGLGFTAASSLVTDCRRQPGHGYDFASCAEKAHRRYIEVKAIAMRGEDVRFFLSENERRVSLSLDHVQNYYFYLVRFKDHEPLEVRPVPSREMHAAIRLLGASYEARLRWTK